MLSASWEIQVESQTEIKFARKNNNLRYADGATLMVESEEEQNSLMMRTKEESGKASLKLNIQKCKILASGHDISDSCSHHFMANRLEKS